MDDTVQMVEPDGLGSGFQQDNSTGICPAEIPGPSNVSILPAPIAATTRGFEVLYDMFLIMAGLFLNLLVVILVFRYKKLRTISFSITVQVALVNVLVILVRTFPALISHGAGYWVFGTEFCVLTGFVSHALTSARTLLVFAFSVDCFSLLFFPFLYPRHRRYAIMLLCVLAWLFSVVFFAAGLLPGMDCYVYNELVVRCSPSPMCSTNCRTLYIIIIITLILPSITIPALLFFAMYLKGRKIRKNESVMLGVAQKAVSEQDWRAIKTFFLLLVGIFVITCVPFVFVKIAVLLGRVLEVLVVKFNAGISSSHIILDPIIIMRNADVKEVTTTVKKSIKDYCQKFRMEKNVEPNSQN